MEIARNHVYPKEVADSINRRERTENTTEEYLKDETYPESHNPYGRNRTKRAWSLPPQIAKNSDKKRKAKNKAQRQARARARR